MLRRKNALGASSTSLNQGLSARMRAKRRLHVESLERRQLLAELAQVTMEVTNLAGDTQTTLVSGQEYYLKAYVQDLRSAEALGVAAAFFDVAVNNNDLLTIEDQTGAQAGILFSGNYPLSRTGVNEIETLDSEFDEVGAATLSQYGSASTPFFQVKFTADAEGQLIFSANQAELTGNLFSLVGAGVIANADVVFGDVTVDVVDPIALTNDAVNRIEDAAQSTIDVLANDVGGAARWTIQTISDISGGGSAEVSADGKTVLYVPAAGFVGAETFVYSAVDENGVAGQATVTVTVNEANDAPINIVPGPQTYNNTDRTIVFDATRPIRVTDIDAGDENVRVTLFVNRGTIFLNTTAGLTFLNGSANNTRYLLFDGTLAEVNAALEDLEYTANAGSTSDVLTIDTHDLGHTGAGGAKVDRDTITLTLEGASAENQPPVNTVPIAQVYNDSDRTVTFAGASQISVDDPDVGNGNMRVTLFVNRGVISLDTTAGLTFRNGSSNNSRYLLFDGTKDAINNALDGMTYTANVDAQSDVLTIDTHDLGNTGTGGAKVDRDTVILTMAGVTENQAPVNTVPLARFFTENDRTVTFDALSRVRTSDPDAGNDPVRVTLFVNRGVINLSQTTGLTFRNGADGTRYLLFDGSIDDVNAAMLNMTYTANAGATSDVLTLDVHDLGNNGTGGAKVDRDTVQLNLAGTIQNTPPINIVPGTQTFTDANRTIEFGLLNPVSTFDADAGNDPLRVTLFVNRGTIALSTTQGLTFRGGANNTRYLLFDGSQDDIRDALFGMTYTANVGTTNDVFTIDVHDLGHNGSGGHKVDRDSFAINRVSTAGRLAGGGSGEAGSANVNATASATEPAASAGTSSSADAIFTQQTTLPPSRDGAARMADLLASTNSGRARATMNADAVFAGQV
jgi:hypothetical protein